MKDPRYSDNAWSGQAVTLRIRLDPSPMQPAQLLSSSPATSSSIISSPSPATRSADVPATCKVVRSSEESLAILRNLPSTSTVLLFTPVLLPAGRGKAITESLPVDPFEIFGRILSSYHKRIRHVPYVAKVGFTETHAAFVSQADVVITLICEPEADGFKHQSVSNQMDFAEAALDTVEGKEASASDEFVLVQFGADQFRLQADAGFMNVFESLTYNVEAAKAIVSSIFGAKY